MRTKNIILAVIYITAVCSTELYGQGVYYQTSTTYDLSDEVSFQCDVMEYGQVTLYNTNNLYTNVEWKYANGNPITVEIADGITPTFTMTEAADTNIQSRANNALTSSQKQIIGDWTLPISIIVNPQTGRIIEVRFSFGKNTPYNRIPPSTFRAIEQSFLSNPVIPGFTVTAVGRQLNYIMFSWAHKFN